MTAHAGLAATPMVLDPVGRLDASVAELHQNPRTAVGRGHFSVRRGRWLANLVASGLRLPAAGDAVAVSIRVERFDDHEVWHRTLGHIRLTTTLEADGNTVVERIGRHALTFSVAAESGSLVMRLTHLSSRIAGVTVRWPRRLGFDIDARVAPSTLNGVYVSVEMRHRWGGRLLAYAGDLAVSTPKEES